MFRSNMIHETTILHIYTKRTAMTSLPPPPPPPPPPPNNYQRYCKTRKNVFTEIIVKLP